MGCITLYETAVYLQAATQYLTEHEQEGVRHLLAAKPLTGYYDDDLDLFVLDWGREPALEIIYAISPTLVILLLEVGPKSEPVAKSAQLADVIKIALKAGAIAAAKDVARKLWDISKDLFS
ncbi:MAG: hypothetical protein ACR2RB_05095 [Gammaproteobacteria bacterium]